jgi:hypothetical protein
MTMHTCTRLHLYALDFTRMLAVMGFETGTTEVSASELSEIAWHWEKAYKVSNDGGVYVAARIGYPEHVLTADTPNALRSVIRSDYLAWLASLSERSSL